MDFRIKHPEFDSLPIIVETETNSRYDGDIVREHLTYNQVFRRGLKQIGKVEFASDQSINRTGVIKTYPRTRSYVFNFNEALKFQTFKILDTISTSNEKVSITRILREAKDELARFAWPDIDHENPRYTRRRGPSGKIGCKNDDMCIALQMLLYYSRVRKVERAALEHYSLGHNTTNIEVNRSFNGSAFAI